MGAHTRDEQSTPAVGQEPYKNLLAQGPTRLLAQSANQQKVLTKRGTHDVISTRERTT